MTADSRRLRVLLSRGYIVMVQHFVSTSVSHLFVFRGSSRIPPFPARASAYAQVQFHCRRIHRRGSSHKLDPPFPIILVVSLFLLILLPSTKQRNGTKRAYLGAGNDHLDLAAGGAHELAELGDDAGEETETVVLGEGGEEVLDGLAGDIGALLKLGNDGALVGGGEGGSREDVGELGVLSEEVSEAGDGLGGRLEGVGLDGGRVLYHV